LYCGAHVDFVDIDPETLNMSVDALEKKLVEAENIGKLPKILVPVHFAGQSCDMKAIQLLANKYGFRIIEDASHAIGGKYYDEYIGSCRYSDITVFSFHPVKIITTGEGGLLTTNSEELAARLQRYRSHGITREPNKMTKESDGPWYYQQLELGYNYRITDIQAALGSSQLTRIEQFVERRNNIANFYKKRLEEMAIRVQKINDYCRSAFHLYVVCIKLDQVAKTKRDIFLTLRNADIGVNVHYIPVHTQPFYQNLGFKPGDFPMAEKYYAEALSIPMYPGLAEEQQEYVVEQLKAAIQ
jgi:dTDP-4-amino-4,6-dideoxygalactose transaminase